VGRTRFRHAREERERERGEFREEHNFIFLNSLQSLAHERENGRERERERVGERDRTENGRERERR